MPDYAKTVIYQIECKDPNITKTYGGHSTNLIKRRQRHKGNCNNPDNSYYNIYVYRFIRENGGWDNWQVVWQYDYPCENKRQAEKEERIYIKKNKCELNTYIPSKEDEIEQEQAERLRKKRQSNAKSAAKKRAEIIENETAEEKAERLRIKKEDNDKRLENKTEEEKAEIKRLRKERYDKDMANETPEEKAERNRKNKECRVRRIENETAEKKAER